MIGAIAGDIIGSIYEVRPIKSKNFPLFDDRCTFTDDSVLTVAVALAILSTRSYRDCLHELGRCYPHAGYGGAFIRWLAADNPRPYNSWGNGSAMRVSPVGWAFGTEKEVLEQARLSAEVSHNHPEGIKGAQATALAVFLARTGAGKEGIRRRIGGQFGYDLQRSVDQIRPACRFEVSCQKSVPEAIVAFLDSESYEDAVRNAVSLGGATDTQACISGAIAEAYFGGVPGDIQKEALKRLTPPLREITERFYRAYCED